MSSVARETRGVLRALYACFFLSGALGLVYEILWLRKLLLVFGSTVHAVSTVLTVFFGGLALGSWLFGRFIDGREAAGLRWYAALEAGVGLLALATLPLFGAIQRIYIPIYQASGYSTAALVGAAFVCSVLILLLPTTLLGATFPVLSRFVIRATEERGMRIASLYGINTAGAMAGTLFVYYVGLPMLGVTRTMFCAAVLNLWIGAMGLIIDRRLELLGFRVPASPATKAPLGAREESVGTTRWLLAAFGLSGFSAIAYEVAWTRALSLVLGSSIYAFCIVLASFLGGMALGSLVAGAELRRRPANVRTFVQAELVLGAYGLFSVPLLTQLPDWFVLLWPLMGRTFAGLQWLQFLLSALAMLVPTLLMGFLFPVVSDLVTRRFGQLGRRLGAAYAVNTVGGILGSFLAGFVLIPGWGVHWAVIAAALVNFLAAFAVYVRLGEAGSFVRRAALATAVVAGAVFLGWARIAPAWQPQVFAEGAYLNPEGYGQLPVRVAAARNKLLYYRDGLNTTVSVHQRGETLFLKVGGKTDASTGIDMVTQLLAAHIPLVLHRHPQRVFVLGLGSGMTLGSAGRHGVPVLDCAEIEQAVVEGARWFRRYNDAVHDDPRVRLFVVDGRNFLLAGHTPYDVIISEPSNPWMAGVGYLFTREFYQLAKQRLAPGGLVCQWLQLYRIFPGDVKMVLKTFHEEFPYVSVWAAVPGDLLLVGSLQPQQTDYASLTQRLGSPAVHESLARVHIDGPALLLQLFRLGNLEVEQLTADTTWLHQDDQPWMEFNAPKALYAGPSLDLNVGGVERFRASPREIVPDYDPAVEQTEDFQLALGRLELVRDDPLASEEAFQRAATLAPTSSAPLVQLAELYLRSRNALKAEDMLRRALRVNPEEVAAYQLLARLAIERGDLVGAKDLYRQASSREVPDSELAEEIGHSLQVTHELTEAAEWYRSSLSQASGARRSLLLSYAQALEGLKELALAEQVLALGASAFQDDPIFPLRLGELLLDTNRAQEALVLFTRALAIEPALASAHMGLGRIAWQQGDAVAAVRLLKRGLRYDPYHGEGLKLLQEIQGTPGLVTAPQAMMDRAHQTMNTTSG